MNKKLFEMFDEENTYCSTNLSCLVDAEIVIFIKKWHVMLNGNVSLS